MSWHKIYYKLKGIVTAPTVPKIKLPEWKVACQSIKYNLGKYWMVNPLLYGQAWHQKLQFCDKLIESCMGATQQTKALGVAARCTSATLLLF